MEKIALTGESACVPKHAFAFCRYGMMLLIWAAWLLHWPWLVALATLLLFASAKLTVARAPLVLLYTRTVHRLLPSPEEELNIRSMRFAHTLGTVLGTCCLLLLVIDAEAGWWLVFVFCLLKTVSAFGLCPAYKLHRCLTSGGCCAFLRRNG